jgi:hypothetical protein
MLLFFTEKTSSAVLSDQEKHVTSAVGQVAPQKLHTT